MVEAWGTSKSGSVSSSSSTGWLVGWCGYRFSTDEPLSSFLQLCTSLVLRPHRGASGGRKWEFSVQTFFVICVVHTYLLHVSEQFFNFFLLLSLHIVEHDVNQKEEKAPPGPACTCGEELCDIFWRLAPNHRQKVELLLICVLRGGAIFECTPPPAERKARKSLQKSEKCR